MAGASHLGDGGPAIRAQLGNIQGIAVDRAGNVYLSDTDRHRVRRISPNGIITTIAGTGARGFSGDGGPAAAAQLSLPYGLAVDHSGTLYIADLENGRVRRVTAEGVISTVESGLAAPRNVAVDATGNLYISEFEGHRVRRVGIDGRIAVVAGNGAAGFRGDGGLATAAQLAFPAGLAVDRAGTVYVADSQNQRVRKFTPGGVISTVLGGISGTALFTPLAVAADALGNLFVADSSAVVRTYSWLGSWYNVAGTGTPGFNGDGPAVGVQIADARDLAVDAAGNLYLADGVRVRRVDSRGVLQTLAGDGYLTALGDGGPATQALLLRPSAVAFDASGSLYIADTGTGRVRRVRDAGISTLAGTLHAPMGVAVDPLGNVTVADTGSDRVVQVQAGAGLGVLVSVGLRGPRSVCFDGTGGFFIVDTLNNRVLRNGVEIRAELKRPSACAADASGNLYVADTGNDRIRKITARGAATTIDAGPLHAPSGVAVSAPGDLFVSDTGNHRIRHVTPDGMVETIAGDGFAGWSGDGGPSLAARLDSPGGLALDGTGNLYFADTGNDRIRRLVFVAAAPPVTVLHAASLRPGPVAPRQLVTIAAAATEVRFDGVIATILSSQDGVTLVQAPDTIAANSSTHLEVYDKGRLTGIAELAVVAVNPALFPLVTNQDGSINSPDAPAPRGSIVTFYGTGAGLDDLPVALSIAGIPAELPYAGAAPGLAGQLQINARVPGGLIPPGVAAVELQVGTAAAPPVTMRIK